MKTLLLIICLFTLTSSFAQLEKMVYPPKEPFTDFLQEPISEVSVSFYFGGCYLQNMIQVTYKKTTDNHLKAKYWTEKHQDDKSVKERYQQSVSSIELIEALVSINKHPNATPSIEDFNLTTQDKQDYLDWVDTLESNHGNPNFFKDSSTRLFYQSIVHDLDTLSSSTILQALQYCHNLVYISSYADLEITIKNQQQDSIKIIKKGLLNPTPWNLPLTICHHQKCFESYHPELVKVLREYLPNTAIFLNRGFPHCQNKYLIKQIADYLYQQQKE